MQGMKIAFIIIEVIIMNELIPVERIENKIFLIKGQKVMLDRDLAALYGVQTKRLNEAVKRNSTRFPGEFMFQLSEKEKLELVANCGRFSALKHSTSLPYAFNEHGVAMLSSVLNSEKAVQVNILIIKTFIRLSRIITSHKELACQVEELQKRYGRHEVEISMVFKLLKKLMEPGQEKPAKKIGFVVGNKEGQ